MRMEDREHLARRLSARSSQPATVDDLSLPSPRTPLFDDDTTFDLPERSNSESDVAALADNNGCSRLNVCGRHFVLGQQGQGQSSKVKVTWRLGEEYGSDDWIGLFPIGMNCFGQARYIAFQLFYF